jgi:ATP-dependent Lhr-like helicase
VTHLDWKRRAAQVEPWAEGGRSRWRGQGQPLSFALCQAMRDVLTEEREADCWSRRARARLADLREEFGWLEPDRASVVMRVSAGLEWWTFAGGRTNAGLAHELGVLLGTTSSWDNLAIRCLGDYTLSKAAKAIADLQRRGAVGIEPVVDEAAMEGLKFSACLPAAMATEILRSRLTDQEGVRSLLSMPVQFVAATEGKNQGK